MMHTWVKNMRYGLLASGLYCLFLSAIGNLFPSPTDTPVVAAQPVTATVQSPSKPSFTLISGKPIRIVLPATGIDLPIDEGFYSETDGTWTLSDTHAQYAMMSTLANNASGNTFIYGHGTEEVFGKLASLPPASGDIALIYTVEGHVFEYSFTESFTVAPTDTSVLDYTPGLPVLTVQTCSGTFSEWRTMYRFTFRRTYNEAA